VEGAEFEDVGGELLPRNNDDEAGEDAREW
jgi:hypothetical protein